MRPALALTIPALALSLAACSGGESPAPATSGPSGAAATARPTGTVIVFAAASLKESFTKMGAAFMKANPGVKVTFNFGGSSTLANSITQGAPADVFASAAATNMDQVLKQELVNKPAVFARNSMEIVVPTKNPAKIAKLSDLGKKGVKLVLCQPKVPCGSVGAKVLTEANLKVTPASLEPDVKAVLSKVQLGEADAGLVYISDVRAARGKVKGILLPASIQASTDYPIATLAKARNKAGAEAFMAYVLSRAGQEQMAANGFTRP